MYETVCCFFGHREITQTEELKAEILKTIEHLITKENVDTFLFGSKSQFNNLCYELITKIKEKYLHIKRICVRAEYPYINDEYKSYLLEYYEDTYYPKEIIKTSKSVYIQRNYEMIDKSQFCVVYCRENYSPPKRKSGTKIALQYATKKQKTIFMFPICDIEK